MADITFNPQSAQMFFNLALGLKEQKIQKALLDLETQKTYAQIALTQTQQEAARQAMKFQNELQPSLLGQAQGASRLSQAQGFEAEERNRWLPQIMQSELNKSGAQQAQYAAATANFNAEADKTRQEIDHAKILFDRGANARAAQDRGVASLAVAQEYLDMAVKSPNPKVVAAAARILARDSGTRQPGGGSGVSYDPTTGTFTSGAGDDWDIVMQGISVTPAERRRLLGGGQSTREVASPSPEAIEDTLRSGVSLPSQPSRTKEFVRETVEGVVDKIGPRAIEAVGSLGRGLVARVLGVPESQLPKGKPLLESLISDVRQVKVVNPEHRKAAEEAMKALQESEDLRQAYEDEVIPFLESLPPGVAQKYQAVFVKAVERIQRAPKPRR